MLTKDEINRYKKDGYVVPNFSMPEEVLKKIEFRHNKLLAKFPDQNIDAGFWHCGCDNHAAWPRLF